MTEEREEKDYLKVIPDISKMLDDDDPENDFPISHSMKTEKRYSEGKELGSGAMKQVTLAKDELTDRKVAMARLRESGNLDNAEQFFLEARLTARLQHPNIVPVYDAGYDQDGNAFFTMKPVGGLTLRHFIKSFEGHSADFQERLEIFIKICDAMAFAHSNNIVHRDLKPDNIYLGDYGEVLVGDWGLAKIIDGEFEDLELFSSETHSNETMHGIIKGTPGYMAPEQIDKNLGPSDHLSDLYALGIILFELLCLRNPIQETVQVEEILKETLVGLNTEPSSVNPAIPESLEAIILKAVAVDRKNRYTCVKELISDIKKFQGGFITSAERSSFSKSFVYLLKRHKSVSLLLLLIITGSVFFISSIITEKQIAEGERNEAVEQKKIADEQKEIAVKQKEIADKARFDREKISKEASPRFLSVAINDFNNFRFESAATNINLAVSLDPENLDARRFLGMFLFVTQRFTESKNLFDTLDRKIRRTKIYRANEMYAKLKADDSKLLTATQIEKFLKDNENVFTRETPPARIIHHLVNYTYIRSEYTLEEKLSFTEAAFKIISFRLQENWKLKADIKDGKVNMDLSEEPIATLNPIQRFPLYSLNINNTSFKNLAELKNSSLEILILGNKRVLPQEIRRIKNIKEVHTSMNFLDDKLKGITIIKTQN